VNEKFVKGGPVPNSLGGMADLYSDVRELRLGMQKAVDEVHERETELYNMMLATLKESPDNGAVGERYRVQLVQKEKVQAKDWPALHAFIRQYDQFQLLQKRLLDSAVAEFIEVHGQQLPGGTLPGTEKVVIDGLSVTKR
jgi:hypothetical protein